MKKKISEGRRWRRTKMKDWWEKMNEMKGDLFYMVARGLASVFVWN